MQQTGEDKDHRAGEPAAEATTDEGRVDVSTHEMVNGFVPGTPVSTHGRAIPPIGVEFAVAETHEFGQGVEDGLEDGEEARQPDDEGDGGEFHQTLDDGCDVQGFDFIQRVAEDRGGVLGAGEPDEHAEGEAFCQALGDE